MLDEHFFNANKVHISVGFVIIIYLFFQPHQIGMPVSSVTFQEILDTIQEKNVILKIDIEGAECKVNF